MSEKKVESHLCDRAKRMGGMAFKFVSPGMTGASDRLVLLPVPAEHQEIVQKYVKLVETKARGEQPRPLQRWFMEEIRSLGHCAEWVDSPQSVEALFK